MVRMLKRTLCRQCVQGVVCFLRGDGSLKMKRQIEKKTLLIVDDVELFIQLQISHLGHQRYDIHTARSGSEGLEMVRSLKPDIVLMDMFMPDINGDQVCRLLKEDPDTWSIPVVLVSSGGRGWSRAASLSSKCDGLIFKPVRRDLLLSVVENLLGTNLRARDRIQVSIPGSVLLEGTDYPVTLHSLSSSGAFIETEEKMIRGDLLELTFALPDRKQKIRIRAAAVIWCGSLREDGPPGTGIHFLTIDEETRKHLNIFVHENMSVREGTHESDAAKSSM